MYSSYIYFLQFNILLNYSRYTYSLSYLLGNLVGKCNKDTHKITNATKVTCDGHPLCCVRKVRKVRKVSKGGQGTRKLPKLPKYTQSYRSYQCYFEGTAHPPRKVGKVGKVGQGTHKATEVTKVTLRARLTHPGK